MKVKDVIERLKAWIRSKVKRENDPYHGSFHHYRHHVLQEPRNTLLDKLLQRFIGLKQYLFEQEPDAESPPQEQPAGRSYKRLKVLGTIVLFSVVLLFGFAGIIKDQLLKLDFFLLKNIRVTGCLKTTTDSIREHSGLKYNTRLFGIDLSNLEKQLESHSWVEEARVKRHLPDTLRIIIKEYTPKAILQVGEKKELFYIDKQGTPFVEIARGENMDFPVITGIEKINQSQDSKKKLTDIMGFLQKTDKDDPNLNSHAVSQLHVDSDEGTVLFLVDFPFPIFLGKDDIQNRYNRLKKVVGFLYKEREKGMKLHSIAYIRLNYLDNKVLIAHTGKVER